MLLCALCSFLAELCHRQGLQQGQTVSRWMSFASIQNAVLALALTSFLRHVCGQCLLGILASDLSQLLNTLLLQA